MTTRPRLADVQCSRLKFEPGDRILVKTYCPLEAEARRRLQRTVERWAGDHVEVLIVDCTKMEIIVDKQSSSQIFIP